MNIRSRKQDWPKTLNTEIALMPQIRALPCDPDIKANFTMASAYSEDIPLSYTTLRLSFQKTPRFSTQTFPSDSGRHRSTCELVANADDCEELGKSRKHR